jgi:hypothetical protein
MVIHKIHNITWGWQAVSTLAARVDPQQVSFSDPRDLFSRLPKQVAMADESLDSGWALVAEEDEAARVIAGLLTIDADREYTRSELAEEVGIPLKTLYLIEILDNLETAGMLQRLDDPDDDSEARFVIDDDSQVYQAAERFGVTLAENL